MKIIKGRKVEIVSHDDYWKRFPDKNLCEMCPFKSPSTCDDSCPYSAVYVEIYTSIIWR